MRINDMKRKDCCPLRHKGSQCAEQEAAEKLTVLQKVIRIATQRREHRQERKDQKPQDCSRWEPPSLLPITGPRLSITI